jgi:cysteine desulfurase family protein (TIGR01976 family)
MGAAATPAQLQSLEQIRSRFPALDRREGEFPVAYFDGPGGTQVPRSVVEAVSDYLFHHNANTHWAFPTSGETDALIANARVALADLLNANPSEIVFGPNMTTLTFHLARALGRSYGPGDEIVVTELDHHANVAPWQALAQERGVTLRIARMVPETGQLDWKDFERKVNERTKVLAVGVASNALGTVNDVRRAAELAHRAGALLFADAVHSVPHLLTDVKALGCDFLACSAYKFYGPHVGVLFGRKELLQSADFAKLIPAPNDPPARAETGTQNHEGIVGAAAAVDFLASVASGKSRRERLKAAFDAIETRGHALAARIWAELSIIRGVRLYGPPPSEPRTPTLAFTIHGVPAREVAHRLGERGIFVSHGNFYAATVTERLGLGSEGLVRVGCACYTTDDEVLRLIEAVRRVAGDDNRR